MDTNIFVTSSFADTQFQPIPQPLEEAVKEISTMLCAAITEQCKEEKFVKKQ